MFDPINWNKTQTIGELWQLGHFKLIFAFLDSYFKSEKLIIDYVFLKSKTIQIFTNSVLVSTIYDLLKATFPC